MMSVASAPPPLNRSSTMTACLSTGEEIAGEVREPAECGIRQIDVRDAAAGHPGRPCGGCLQSARGSEAVFVGDWHDGHRPGTAPRRIGADADLHLLPDGGFEKAVHVVGRREVAAVDRHPLLTGHDVDAGLGQRRGRLRVPVLAVVDAGEPVTPVLDLVVAPEQAGLDALDVRLLAAADAEMADDQFPSISARDS